jgi:hypothetical protein
MKIKEPVLKEVIETIRTGATKDRKITFYSTSASRILRYIDLMTPGFSKGGAAAQALSITVAKAYPELWEIAEKELPGRTREADKKFLPDTIEIDNDTLNKVFEETDATQGRIITIYNMRLTAVFRYLANTEPRFSISKEAGKLIDAYLSEKYPELWEKINRQ